MNSKESGKLEETAAGRGLSVMIMASGRASFIHTGKRTSPRIQAECHDYKGQWLTLNPGNKREKGSHQSETHEACEVYSCQKLAIDL